MIHGDARRRIHLTEVIDLSAPSALPHIDPVRLREEQDHDTLLLDTRPGDQFAALHPSGALQIGLEGRFSSWAAILIAPSVRLLLIAEDAARAAEARVRLGRVGLSRVIGYATLDGAGWRAAGVPTASMPLRRCKDLGPDLDDPNLQLIDARSRAEWLKGHLPHAVSAPLLELEKSLPAIPRAHQRLVYCRQGWRATTAASILLRWGMNDVGVLLDGVEGWTGLGWPLQIPTAASGV
jgi:hydroxyacylglutathione hydrolase